MPVVRLLAALLGPIGARRVRAVGVWASIWSLALAAVIEAWPVLFLVGVFVYGVGMGMGGLEE